MKSVIALMFLMVAQAAAAQTVPMPDEDNMRLQTVRWAEDETVLLTVSPAASLTVILEQNEQIERITLSEGAVFSVRVPPDGNSFVVIPEGDIARATFTVETARKTYPFILRTQNSPLAALLVRFDTLPASQASEEVVSAPEGDVIWSYRLRGDREVRPTSIRDDTRRTFIEYAPGQSLPAVFAIGPTGEEEVVNGYMRSGIYVIDRVYQEVVFRIDDERATARRNSEPDGEG